MQQSVRIKPSLMMQFHFIRLMAEAGDRLLLL